MPRKNCVSKGFYGIVRMVRKMKKVWTIIGVIVIVLAIATGAYFLTREKEEARSTSENLIDLSGEEFKKKIENQDSFILVVSRDGCHFCQEYYPILIDVIEKYDVTAYRINTTKLNDEERKYLDGIATVTGTPTTLFINEGTETTTLNRLVGGQTKTKIIERFKSLGYIK